MKASECTPSGAVILRRRAVPFLAEPRENDDMLVRAAGIQMHAAKQRRVNAFGKQCEQVREVNDRLKVEWQ